MEHSSDVTSHLSEDHLEMYVLGRLQEPDVPALEEHLLICGMCQQKLDRMADLSIGMREALAESQPGRVATARGSWFEWLRRPAFAMAVAFATVLLVIGVFSKGRVHYAPSASLQLTAMRGEMPTAIPARRFDLKLADAPRAGGPFRVSVVDATGGSIWSGAAASGSTGVEVTVEHPLSPGDYFVRLYSADGAMLNEYGFHVR